MSAVFMSFRDESVYKQFVVRLAPFNPAMLTQRNGSSRQINLFLHSDLSPDVQTNHNYAGKYKECETVEQLNFIKT